MKGCGIMLVHQIVTPCWDGMEIVQSPVNGTVEEIQVQPGDRVHDYRSLLAIRKENGALKKVFAGINGMVDDVNVKIGDKIVPGEVLVFINEDTENDS